jgi:predicted nucleic-acid-binding protein
MIGIDTNVLLRLLLDDDPAQSARIEAWLGTLPAVVGQIHVTDVVLAEVCWTLASIYQQPKSELLRALRGLLSEPMFSFDNRAAVETAVAAYEGASCGFPDCLIVARNLSSGCTGTATFDRRMQKLPGANLL